jgi:uncharacterized protein DUF4234
MQPRPKVQSAAVVVALSILTLGIYSLFWYYRVNREMRDFGRAVGDVDLSLSRPDLSVWALALGGLLVIPGIVTMGNTALRVGRCERRTGGEPQGSVTIVGLVIAASVAGVGSILTAGATALVLLAVDAICWYAAIYALQRRVNALWSREPSLAAPERAGDLVAAA